MPFGVRKLMYFEPDMLAPSAIHKHFGACMHFASETSKYAKLNEVEPDMLAPSQYQS